jgi:hypothetical protein
MHVHCSILSRQGEGFFTLGTTHLHLVPRSRMRGVIPRLPRYAFMAWCLVKTQGQLYLYLTKRNIYCRNVGPSDRAVKGTCSCTARTLGSWFRAPLATLMYARVLLFCAVDRGVAMGRSLVQGVL